MRTLAQPAEPASGLAPGAVLRSLASQATYTAERRLGAGAFGTVWLCREGQRGERRAVKLLCSERAAALAAEVEQLRRAVEASGEFCVPRLYEAAEATVLGQPGSKHLLIAMEFVDGATASVLASAAAMPAPCTSTILGDVAVALGRLHLFGLVHRDVKGDNIMVSVDGHSYLCDFGLSAHVEELRSQGGRHAVGTPDFMAPEILGKVPRFTDRVDVWAFGILAIELANNGRTPARDMRLLDPQSVMEYTAISHPPAAPQLPGYPGTYVDAVEMCLQRDPEQRASIPQLVQRCSFVRPPGDPGYRAVRAHFKTYVPRTGSKQPR